MLLHSVLFALPIMLAATSPKQDCAYLSNNTMMVVIIMIH